MSLLSNHKTKTSWILFSGNTSSPSSHASLNVNRLRFQFVKQMIPALILSNDYTLQEKLDIFSIVGDIHRSDLRDLKIKHLDETEKIYYRDGLYVIDKVELSKPADGLINGLLWAEIRIRSSLQIHGCVPNIQSAEFWKFYEANVDSTFKADSWRSRMNRVNLDKINIPRFTRKLLKEHWKKDTVTAKEKDTKAKEEKTAKTKENQTAKGKEEKEDKAKKGNEDKTKQDKDDKNRKEKEKKLSDVLVKPLVLEPSTCFIGTKRGQSDHHLTNNWTQPIAFKFSSNASSMYSVTPKEGVLPSMSTILVAIHRLTGYSKTEHLHIEFTPSSMADRKAFHEKCGDTPGHLKIELFGNTKNVH